METRVKISIIFITIMIIIGIVATTLILIKKNKTEKFLPILSISCADCINKCNDKYKNDPALWSQCALDSINNVDCKCPDIKTILAAKI